MLANIMIQGLELHFNLDSKDSIIFSDVLFGKMLF